MLEYSITLVFRHFQLAAIMMRRVVADKVHLAGEGVIDTGSIRKRPSAKSSVFEREVSKCKSCSAASKNEAPADHPNSAYRVSVRLLRCKSTSSFGF